MNILTLNNVSKKFGNKQVVKNLSFEVPQNKVYGFIGKNGAGKTTTMKMILGLVKADEGEIMVNGERVTFGQNTTNKYIGYLPDVPEFYGYMTPGEYLKLCGKITGMTDAEIKTRSDELLELVGLGEEKKRIKGFSRGMKQRLGIAQALLNSPKLLICDEPTSALDPVGRKEILDVLSKVKEQTTVIFSTHILSDVERICDEVAFLHDGNIVLKGSLDEVKRIRKSSSVQIECFNNADVAKVLKILPEGKSVGSTVILYESADEKKMSEMMMCLAKNDISIQKIEMLEPTLEDLFVEVVSK
ncbi:MAG: ABC transporter ATP-binding protein [Lachnospiraceae bacterium]|nr:ABC transporter ATP-binding protein [Lachnospiraceae bacterium]